MKVFKLSASLIDRMSELTEEWKNTNKVWDSCTTRDNQFINYIERLFINDIIEIPDDWEYLKYRDKELTKALK